MFIPHLENAKKYSRFAILACTYSLQASDFRGLRSVRSVDDGRMGKLGRAHQLVAVVRGQAANVVHSDGRGTEGTPAPTPASYADDLATLGFHLLGRIYSGATSATYRAVRLPQQLPDDVESSADGANKSSVQV